MSLRAQVSVAHLTLGAGSSSCARCGATQAMVCCAFISADELLSHREKPAADQTCQVRPASSNCPTASALDFLGLWRHRGGPDPQVPSPRQQRLRAGGSYPPNPDGRVLLLHLTSHPCLRTSAAPCSSTTWANAPQHQEEHLAPSHTANSTRGQCQPPGLPPECYTSPGLVTCHRSHLQRSWERLGPSLCLLPPSAPGTWPPCPC